MNTFQVIMSSVAVVLAIKLFTLLYIIHFGVSDYIRSRPDPIYRQQTIIRNYSKEGWS